MESEGGKTVATDLAASFYSHFQAVKNDISTRLESLRSADGGGFDSISADIVKLRKELVEATVYLPSYDQRKYEQQLSVLEGSLSSHRTPKSKFTFKRKPANADPPVPPPSSPTPVPVPVPPPPQTPTPTPTPTPPSTSTILTFPPYTFKRLTTSSLLSPSPARGSDLTLTDLTACIINLSTPYAPIFTTLRARALRRVVLIIPPLEGSVLLHDIHDSLIIVGCHQFRMHDSRNTTVLLHALSTPIIENSTTIHFGAYLADLQHLSPSMTAFFASPSRHALVQDFDWIKSSASPNWSILEPSVEGELVGRVVELVKAETVPDVERALEDILPRRLADNSIVAS